MKSILAYADKQSLFPGEELEFKVSTENIEEYDVEIVRLKEPAVGEGDDFPDYSPIKMETDLPKKIKGRKQETAFGSYAIVEESNLLNNSKVGSRLIFSGHIFPTLIKEEDSTVLFISNTDGSKYYKLCINSKGFEVASSTLKDRILLLSLIHI